MFGFSRNPERHQKIGRAVRVVVGLILLASAALKLDDLLYGEATALLWLPSPRWVFAAIEVEALVGLWLLSGWQARWAWGVALALFCSLGIISLILALQGQSTCGCFGRVGSYIHPWFTTILDVIVVAVLLVTRPRSESGAAISSSIRQAICLIAGTALLFGVAVLSIEAFGIGPTEALSRLRGETLGVDPVVSDVGKGTPGESRVFLVELINLSDDPVRFYGGTSDCSCVTIRDLPLTIPPHARTEVHFRMKFTGSDGRFQQRYVLLCQRNDELLRIVGRFTGVVFTPEDTRLGSIADPVR